MNNGNKADDETAPRVENPTVADTPATFDFRGGPTTPEDWGHSENGPVDPTPDPMVCTLVGFGTTSLSGRGPGYSEDDSLYRIKTALDILRRHGYRCELPPQGWTSGGGWGTEQDDENSNESPRDPEIEFLKENYDTIVVKERDSDAAAFHVATMRDPWLVIRCSRQEGASFVLSAFREHYKLAVIKHDEVSYKINCGDDLTILRRTGNSSKTATMPADKISASDIGTLFELKKSGKTIVKCLCSYENGEMDTPGPTIELFETAAEWKRHGYGKILLRHVEGHFWATFIGLSHANAVYNRSNPDFKIWGKKQGPVMLNVCYCTSSDAFKFFLANGFDDLDGMGEELGKTLF